MWSKHCEGGCGGVLYAATLLELEGRATEAFWGQDRHGCDYCARCWSLQVQNRWSRGLRKLREVPLPILQRLEG